MFSILLNRLRSVSGHTALLEACDWDEDIMDAAFKDLDSVLSSSTALSAHELSIEIRKKLRIKMYNDEVIKLLIKLINIEIKNEILTTKGET
jgi:hypothetical protein